MQPKRSLKKRTVKVVEEEALIEWRSYLVVR